MKPQIGQMGHYLVDGNRHKAVVIGIGVYGVTCKVQLPTMCTAMLFDAETLQRKHSDGGFLRLSKRVAKRTRGIEVVGAAE